MNVDSIEFKKIDDFYWKWVLKNDLDNHAIQDPIRAAYFAACAMQKLSNIADPWSIREYVELQIDSLAMFSEMQRNKGVNE